MYKFLSFTQLTHKMNWISHSSPDYLGYKEAQPKEKEVA